MSSLPQLESLELRQLLSSSLVADFNGVFPTNAVAIDGISYFTADEGINGYELWKSDGTIPGTVLVKDLIAGKAGSQLTMAAEIDGALLFFSRLDDGTLSLWRSDGTSAGTSKLADIGHQDARAKMLYEIVNGHLVFVVHGGPVDGQVSIWSSDGTSAGTSKLQTIFDGEDYNHVLNAFVVNGRMLIPSGDAHVWSTDGTPAGTSDVGVAMDGAKERVYLHNHTAVVMNGQLFVASDTQDASKLWKSDGTLAGTTLVKAWPRGGYLGRLVVVNDHILLKLSGPNANQDELWRTDGTEAGTVVVMSIDGRLKSEPVELDGAAVFLVTRSVTNDNRAPFEVSLWHSDATAEGTYQIKTFPLNMRNSWNIDSAVTMNGVGYFILQARENEDYVRDRRQLWRTDGTAEGTSVVQDLSQYRRADIDQRIREQIAKTGSWFSIWDDEDRDSVQVFNSDGRIAVKTPGDTLVFDPATMTAPIGPAHGYARLDDDDTLRVFGTLGQDDIRVYLAPDDPSRLVVNLNGERKSFDVNEVARVRVYGYGGNDAISVLEKYGRLNKRLAVWGGDGNDRIFTGSGRDSIWGESGNDFVNSGRGDDTIAGGSGEDSVNGARGTDVVSGGGGRDRIDGGAGTDVIFGEKVFEIFYNGKKQQDSADLAELVFG